MSSPTKDLKRPPTITGGRRRLRGDNFELQMLESLGAQAQEILRLAVRAASDDTFRSLSNYRSFRQKVSEFEAFCSIIEGHLKEVVSDRRAELEDRFYGLWSTIFRPTVKALRAFFERVSNEDVLPLGGRDLLESELRTIDAMRATVLAPRFANQADQRMLDEIDALQGLITGLAEKATSLPDFAQTVLDDADGPAEAPGAPRAPVRFDPVSGARADDPPNVKAVREFKALLDSYRRDAGYGQYVDTDTRALDEIERKLLAEPMNAPALVWLRQIGSAWMSRLGDHKELRRILGTIRTG